LVKISYFSIDLDNWKPFGKKNDIGDTATLATIGFWPWSYKDSQEIYACKYSMMMRMGQSAYNLG
jgi:hypothetical protein